MKTSEKWRSLKVRDAQYAALAACSERTGRPIIKLGEEALNWFIKEVIPIYNNAAIAAQDSIRRKLRPAQPRQKKGPLLPRKKVQAEPVETVTINPSEAA